jgi:hypothetical protein
MMRKVILNRPATRFSCLSSLSVIFFILLAVAQSAHGQAVKIMPLGDSLTSGHKHYVSYRYDLWFDLIDAGFDVDFVGNLKNTYHDTNLDWYPEYLTTFDRDHEGWWGYRTDELVSIARGSSSRHQPDIVLLWAGGNDIGQLGKVGVSNARFGLRDIIEGIRVAVPGVTILLGLKSPVNAQNSEFIEPLNATIATVASELDTNESPVILVDHYTGFDIGSMTLSGNIHHNRVGEAWIAENWFEVLASIWPASEPFQINAGHSGAWFNTATSGQGQLIDVVPESQYMFLAWFTFTAAASNNPDQQHWYTAQGNYSGSTAELILYETLGGQFDDPKETSTNPVGTVTLSFTDCEHGRMVYNIDTDGRHGTVPLERAIPGSHNICEELRYKADNTAQAVDINAGMDGSWANEDTLGQGFLIDAHPNPDGDNFIFVGWFTYGDDTASGLRWLTAQGDFEGSTAEIDIYETIGGRFDDPQTVEVNKVGTMAIDFTDCSNANLSYSLTDDGLAGDMAISRLIPGGQALCEELAGVE